MSVGSHMVQSGSVRLCAREGGGGGMGVGGGVGSERWGVRGVASEGLGWGEVGGRWS